MPAKYLPDGRPTDRNSETQRSRSACVFEPVLPGEHSYWTMATGVAERLFDATPVNWGIEADLLRRLTDISCSLGIGFAFEAHPQPIPSAFFGSHLLAVERESADDSPPEMCQATTHDKRLSAVATASAPDRFVTVDTDFVDPD